MLPGIKGGCEDSRDGVAVAAALSSCCCCCLCSAGGVAFSSAGCVSFEAFGSWECKNSNYYEEIGVKVNTVKVNKLSPLFTATGYGIQEIGWALNLLRRLFSQDKSGPEVNI